MKAGVPVPFAQVLREAAAWIDWADCRWPRDRRTAPVRPDTNALRDAAEQLERAASAAAAAEVGELPPIGFLFRLRLELYTAAQQLKGEDLASFAQLVREIHAVTIFRRCIEVDDEGANVGPPPPQAAGREVVLDRLTALRARLASWTDEALPRGREHLIKLVDEALESMARERMAVPQ